MNLHQPTWVHFREFCLINSITISMKFHRSVLSRYRWIVTQEFDLRSIFFRRHIRGKFDGFDHDLDKLWRNDLFRDRCLFFDTLGSISMIFFPSIWSQFVWNFINRNNSISLLFFLLTSCWSRRISYKQFGFKGMFIHQHIRVDFTAFSFIIWWESECSFIDRLKLNLDYYSSSHRSYFSEISAIDSI